MKKTAIIITLCLAAIISAGILWFYQRPSIPAFSKRDPILFPPQDNWPPEVISAVDQFKELKGKWREEPEIPIAMFAHRCRQTKFENSSAPNSAPLTKSDVSRLFGDPDIKQEYEWHYFTARSEWSAGYLTIYFNKDKVTFIGGSAGLCARKATADELMMPPEDNETEQGGPGYPPQSVGSPDP